MKLMNIFLIISTLLLTACGGGSSDTTKSTPSVNNPPSANNDSYNVGMNAPIELFVLVNDNDSDAFRISAVSAPTNGSVSNNQSSIIYTPNDTYVGSDTFSYTIKDSVGQESSAVVNINIANIPPKAENDSGETVQSQAIAIDVLVNDISEGGHNLSIASTSSPSNGSISHDGKIITYTPAVGFAGNDSFVYVVRDSYGDETTASVGIKITNVEPIAKDDEYSLVQNESVTIDVLVNDVDAAGDVLELVSIDLPEQGTAQIENNKIVFTPANGFAGSESINYTLIDSYGASSQASLMLDVVNLAPSANDDAEEVLKNYSLTIDVLANDEDVLADDLTIQSVSSPQYGSVEIVAGKLLYQPNTDYVGDDVFGYTIVDSYGASDSAFITVTVNNGIYIKGQLIGFAQAGQAVTLSVGEDEFTGVTNVDGSYSIAIDSENQSALVIAHAESITDNLSLHAYLGTVESLLNVIDDTFSVEKQHLSLLSTAEYELIHYIRAQESETVPVESAADLSAARFLIDADIVLELAISADIMNTSNDIELPVEYASINAFMQVPFTLRKQLSIWREENSTEYYSAYSRLFDNDKITSSPDGLDQVNNILLSSSTSSRFHYARSLILNADMTGKFGGDHTWSKTTAALSLNYNEPFEFSQDKYCGNKEKAFSTFSADSLVIKQLYKTSEYNVYIFKNTGKFTSAACVNSVSNKIEYHTLISKNTQAFQPISGQYHFLSYKKVPDGTEGDYDQVSATFDLADNGSFIETIDTVLTPRTGLWQVVNNKLQLDYDDGVTVYFEKNASYQGMDLLAYYTLDAGSIVSVGETFFVPQQQLSWQNTTGYLRYSEFSLFDDTLDGGFGLKFNTDFTGVQQYQEAGVWKDYASVYTWSLNNNRYKFDYYVDPDTYEFLAFCDVNEDNCFHYRRREVEIIGQLGEQFIVKVYQEAIYPESWEAEEFRSGYIALFDFSEL